MTSTLSRRNLRIVPGKRVLCQLTFFLFREVYRFVNTARIHFKHATYLYRTF